MNAAGNPRAASLTLVAVLLVGGGFASDAMATVGFSSLYVGESAFLSLRPGEMGSFTVFFENSGNQAWVRGSATQVDLAACRDDKITCDSQDSRETPFNAGWLSPTRYATHAQATVAPGAIATFSYPLRVPESAAVGRYRFNGDLVVSRTGERISPQGYFQDVQVTGVSFMIGPGVPAQHETDVRRAIASVRSYLDAVVGGDHTGAVAVNVFASKSGGAPPGWLGYSFYAEPEAVWLDVEGPTWSDPVSNLPTLTSPATKRMKITAGEYVHVWQMGLGGAFGCIGPATSKQKRTPLWMFEGMAEYLAAEALIRDGVVNAGAIRTVWSGEAKNSYAPVQSMDVDYVRGVDVHNFGAFAVDVLVGNSTVTTLRSFCAAVGAGAPWTQAFAAAFGLTPSQFYVEFEQRRRNLP